MGNVDWSLIIINPFTLIFIMFMLNMLLHDKSEYTSISKANKVKPTEINKERKLRMIKKSREAFFPHNKQHSNCPSCGAPAGRLDDCEYC